MKTKLLPFQMRKNKPPTTWGRNVSEEGQAEADRGFWMEPKKESCGLLLRYVFKHPSRKRSTVDLIR